MERKAKTRYGEASCLLWVLARRRLAGSGERGEVACGYRGAIVLVVMKLAFILLVQHLISVDTYTRLL